MKDKLDVKRILIFLAFAFGIAWAGGLVLYLTGGLAESPYTLVILPIVYMGAPSIAHLLTRMLTREGWRDTFVAFKLRKEWRYWLIAWFAPGLLSIVGLVVFFVLFPAVLRSGLWRDPATARNAGRADWAADSRRQPVDDHPQPDGDGDGARADAQRHPHFWGGIRLARVPAAEADAFGRTQSHAADGRHLGRVALARHRDGAQLRAGLSRRAVARFPDDGVVLRGRGALFGWTTMRAGSVWPAVIGHGAINGIAALGALFVKGKPNPLLGPLPVGLIGSVGFAILAAVLFSRPRVVIPVPYPCAGASNDVGWIVLGHVLSNDSE